MSFYSALALWQPLASHSSLYFPNLLLAKKMALLQKSNSVLISAVSLRSQGWQKKCLDMVSQAPPGGPPLSLQLLTRLRSSLNRHRVLPTASPPLSQGPPARMSGGMSRGWVVYV